MRRVRASPALGLAARIRKCPNELATILYTLGKSVEALTVIAPALERGPTWAIKAFFSNCVARANS